MKKGIGLAVLAVMTVSSVGVVAGIKNSKHDFSGLGWNSGGEICEPCHTPHNAQTNQLVPLWNHTNSVTATFQVYTSATLNAVVGQPNNESLACLSCHDGSVALDSFGGAVGSTTISGTKLVGTDLKNDHPISFVYPADGVDSGLYSVTATNVTRLLGAGNRVQCSSCHDVHNGGPAGVTNLLVMSNSGSTLCLQCHNK